MMIRTENITKLQAKEFDLVVIGGGIIGAGIARDAASRGMSVALVEKNDFAFGTSSRSSKLIHGGIRYLENLEFHLVFEALSEREKLYAIAPNLVHPLRFLLPVYENSRVGMTKLSMGMWLYDFLSLFQSPLHERLDAEETLARMPILKTPGLKGSFVYSDAYMDDDRLVIETLRSASRQGAVIANFTEAKGTVLKDGAVIGIKAKDLIGNVVFEIRAKHIVSSVGPWTDDLAPHLVKKWKSILRPTKGVHITLNKGQLSLNEAVVMASDSEKRIVFGIPRHEMIVIGTTDTDFNGDLESVTATSEDIRYLLQIANEYFPGAKISEMDIVATYAGVRPLLKDEANTEGKTSREHQILSDKSGVTFVAGGKYTTYRKIAEDTIKTVLKSFPIGAQMQFAKNNTCEPLNPLCSQHSYQKALLQVPSLSQTAHLPTDEVKLLVERHGLEAEKMLMDWDNRRLSYWEIELRFAILETMCLRLVDFYTRRSPLYLAEPDHGLKYLELLGLQMQSELGWTDAELESQKRQVRTHIETELAWSKKI